MVARSMDILKESNLNQPGHIDANFDPQEKNLQTKSNRFGLQNKENTSLIGRTQRSCVLRERPNYKENTDELVGHTKPELPSYTYGYDFKLTKEMIKEAKENPAKRWTKRWVLYPSPTGVDNWKKIWVRQNDEFQEVSKLNPHLQISPFINHEQIPEPENIDDYFEMIQKSKYLDQVQKSFFICRENPAKCKKVFNDIKSMRNHVYKIHTRKIGKS